MMRSATAFLPPSMITFMNLESSTLPNLGSGRITRLGTSRRRGIFSPHICSVGTFSGTARAILNSHLLDPHGRFRVVGLGARSTSQAEAAPQFPKNQAFLGRLAPYLERDCLRSFTPCRSSEPRTMW